MILDVASGDNYLGEDGICDSSRIPSIMQPVDRRLHYKMVKARTSYMTI